MRDFAPIIPFGVSPSVLVIAPSKEFRSLADLVAAAKAKPGALNYASAGIGSASHMAAERLRVASGIEAQHIPFRGPVEAFTEVMAGRIDFYFLPIAPALPVISDGKVRALAVSTPKSHERRAIPGILSRRCGCNCEARTRCPHRADGVNRNQGSVVSDQPSFLPDH